MPSITSMISTLACLATAVSAMPANVTRQYSTDCEKGTSFSSCGTTIGCFNHDPCVEPPTPASGSTPDRAKGEATATTSSSSIITTTPDAIYDIFPEHPDYAKALVLGVHLETWDNKSQVEQVIVFNGIPVDAKNCGFGWRQAPRWQRTFLVKNSNALAEIRLLSGFPKEGEDVSYNAIEPFDDTKMVIGGPDFSFWDDREHDGHGVGSVECAETLYFMAGFRDPKGDSQVYLGQDDVKSGWVLTYE
jgi:hypothetical protein